MKAVGPGDRCLSRVPWTTRQPVLVSFRGQALRGSPLQVQKLIRIQVYGIQDR